jgi:cyanophycin synthetase
MMVIRSTRVYYGYSRYGEPTVAWFALSPLPAPAGYDPHRVGQVLGRFGLKVRIGDGEVRASDASWVVPFFARLTRELLRQANHDAGHAVVEQPAGAPQASVAIPCEEPESCLFAGELATALLNAACVGHDMNSLQADLNEFLAFSRPRAVDANSRLLRQAARTRGLPTRWLGQAPFVEAPEDRIIRFGLLQIGHGSSSRRLLGPMPAPSDMKSLAMVANRALLMPLLAGQGFPVPSWDSEFPNQSTAGRAVRTASRLGYPVMVKSLVKQEFPHRQSAIRVFGPLHGAEQVTAAFEAAVWPVRKVWVERHSPGARYRFLVIGGRVRAVARRDPPTVTGDGRSTVAQLMAGCVAAAQTPDQRAAWSDMVADDADVDLRLRLAGLTRDSVPASGQRIELRAEGTPYNGGTCSDVTDAVTEEIKRLAERAASYCGLHELAGVDMTIRGPLGEAHAPDCVLLDVLPDPDLVTHARPHDGPPRDVAAELVDTLFAPGETARIPLVAVTGSNGKTTTARMIAHILRQRFRHVGLATTAGAFVDDELILEGDVAGANGAAVVLADERTEVAVLETARGGLIKLGAGFDVCDVGVCLNVTSDHVGLDGIETQEQMAEVKGEVLRRACGCAVLNGDDPRVLAMRERTGAERVILVSRGGGAAEVAAHRARGGYAVMIEPVDGVPWIVGYKGADRIGMLPVAAIPATVGGAVAFNVENALCAAAAAWGLGLPVELIRRALESFGASYECNPGRFNVIDGLPFRAVIDYAHNAEGMHMLCQALRALPEPKRRILLLRTADHRSDEGIRAFARAAAAERFDIYVCSRRGKSPEVPAKLRRTLLEEGIPEESVLLIPEIEEGIARMLELARAGDLVVFLGGKRAGMIRCMLNDWSTQGERPNVAS